MARKQREPVHAVDVSLKAADIARADAAVTLRVWAKGEPLGTIQIGQGTIGWKPAHKRRFQRMSWSRFAANFE
ncbi:MAG: hypothetical protein WDM79_02020 [Terricaulis sp.]